MEVKYVDHYLTDSDVANFARQSFAKLAENFTKEQNDNLIRFLARGMASKDWEVLITELHHIQNKSEAHDLLTYIRKIPEHWIPFSHPHISVRVAAPVPIARQCFKHKIGLVESEESRRYIKSTPVIYIPDEFRAAAPNVKQGSAGKHVASDKYRDLYKKQIQEAVKLYTDMVEVGICPEQARFALPQGAEVNWAWTGSLYAFANVYNQRIDSHAQKEVQVIAEQLDKIISPLYPVSWAALTKGEY